MKTVINCGVSLGMLIKGKKNYSALFFTIEELFT
jgi:hypothetical protein